MTRYKPAMNDHGKWVAFDRHYNAPDPVPAYRDRASAESWCDLRNAVFEGEPTEEVELLRAHHEQIRNF